MVTGGDVGMRTEDVVRAFVDLAETLVDEFDVIDLLQVLANRSVDLLGAAAAGLLLADQDGSLRIAVTSSEQVRLLELYQLQSSEGPCVECYRAGEPVSVTDLDNAVRRWPRFAAAAAAAGYGSVHAVPMRVRDATVGVLNLFGGRTGPDVDSGRLAVAQALTDVAAIALMQGELVRRRETLAQQLQTALDTRVNIEQAKGLVAGRLHKEMDESFELLRSFARRNGRRLADVASEVRRGELQPADLMAG